MVVACMYTIEVVWSVIHSESARLKYFEGFTEDIVCEDNFEDYETTECDWRTLSIYW